MAFLKSPGVGMEGNQLLRTLGPMWIQKFKILDVN